MHYHVSFLYSIQCAFHESDIEKFTTSFTIEFYFGISHVYHYRIMSDYPEKCYYA